MKSQRTRYYGVEASTADSDRTPLYPRSDNTDTGSRSWSCLSRIGTVISIFFFLLGCVKMLLMIPSFMPAPIVPIVPVEPAAFEIAIIGAGPAGTTAADKLRSFALQKGIPVRITIFEQSPAIGGRLVLGQTSGLVYPWNDYTQSPIEPEDITGPSLLFSNNVLRSQATSTDARPDFHETNLVLGIFDGKQISFETKCPYSKLSFGSWLGQIFKYGASIWRAHQLPIGTMGKLHGLANLHSHPWFPFVTIESMIIALHLSVETEMRGEERNRKNGISESYQNEIMIPETSRRLSQSVAEINDLALSMALQDVDQSSSHSGGSTRVTLEEMVRRSGAHLRLDTRVLGLRYELISEDENKWIVESRKEGSEKLEFSAFQKIILATPWDPAIMEIDEEFDYPLQAAGYRSRHLTLFTSRSGLNSSFFGRPHGANLPEQILPRITPNTSPEQQLSGIHEVAFVREVTRIIDDQATTESLFRILSTQKVNDDVLRSVVDGYQDSVTWVHRAFISHAYPLLYARTAFPPMSLSNSFWHTGALETFTTSIDEAMFAGANVAALVIRQLETEGSKR